MLIPVPFVFDTYGHADVRLMDGGWDKWEREGNPTEKEAHPVENTRYTAEPRNPRLRAHLADVLAVVEQEAEGMLLDVRSVEEYRGEVIAPEGSQELSLRAGHVPGAKNVPWKRTINEADGTFKSLQELRRMYAEHGIDGMTCAGCATFLEARLRELSGVAAVRVSYERAPRAGRIQVHRVREALSLAG